MRTKSAPHRAVRGKGAHRTEANPAPGTPAPLAFASSPGLWQVPELPGRSRTTGSTAQHHGQLNSAPWAAPLGTAQHHGQLRSAPRAAPFSTMVSSFQHHGQLLLSTAQRHPCPGPPGTRRCGERPGALPGGCLRSTVGAVPTPSDEEGTQGLGREQTVSSLAGNALLRLPLGLWSLFIQAECREGDVDKEIQPCL